MPVNTPAKKPLDPRIAKMHAAKAAKRAQREAAAAAEPDMDPAYAGNYGPAEDRMGRRSVGTRPNDRAKSAVERAEARMKEQSPMHRRAAQSPGMDVRYDADREAQEELDEFYEEGADPD